MQFSPWLGIFEIFFECWGYLLHSICCAKKVLISCGMGRHFSRTNELLEKMGVSPIDWQIWRWRWCCFFFFRWFPFVYIKCRSSRRSFGASFLFYVGGGVSAWYLRYNDLDIWCELHYLSHVLDIFKFFGNDYSYYRTLCL